MTKNGGGGDDNHDHDNGGGGGEKQWANGIVQKTHTRGEYHRIAEQNVVQNGGAAAAPTVTANGAASDPQREIQISDEVYKGVRREKQ